MAGGPYDYGDLTLTLEFSLKRDVVRSAGSDAKQTNRWHRPAQMDPILGRT